MTLAEFQSFMTLVTAEWGWSYYYEPPASHESVKGRPRAYVLATCNEWVNFRPHKLFLNPGTVGPASVLMTDAKHFHRDAGFIDVCPPEIAGKTMSSTWLSASGWDEPGVDRRSHMGWDGIRNFDRVRKALVRTMTAGAWVAAVDNLEAAQFCRQIWWSPGAREWEDRGGELVQGIGAKTRIFTRPPLPIH